MCAGGEEGPQSPAVREWLDLCDSLRWCLRFGCVNSPVAFRVWVDSGVSGEDQVSTADAALSVNQADPSLRCFDFGQPCKEVDLAFSAFRSRLTHRRSTVLLSGDAEPLRCPR